MARSMRPATRRMPKPASVVGAARDAVPVGPTATGRGIERGPRADGGAGGREGGRADSRRGGGAIAIAGATARAAPGAGAGSGTGGGAGAATGSGIAWAA